MKKGFSILELLIALSIGFILFAVILGIYIVTNKGFVVNKNLSTLKENTKEGIYALEWFFQRWGVGVPCINPNNPQNCAIAQLGSNPPIYPPPSALYVIINKNTPCDEVIFYGSLGGMGFVHDLYGINKVKVMSCRLSTNNTQNCYHIWRGAKVFTDYNNSQNPLIFSISGLSSDNLDCTRVSGQSNGTMDITATALNGSLETFQGSQRILTNQLNLETGDLLIRVPHRIRIFCQNNPNDNNSNWLYVESVDMSAQCNNNEPPIPIIKVNSFQAQLINNGILINMQIVNDKNVLPIQRFYGR